MTSEIERPGATDLGSAVSGLLATEVASLQSRADVAARLGEVFEAIRQRDQAENDVIAEYIKNFSGWSSYTRPGSDHNHYCIDTYIEHQDGGASYFKIDHELPGAEQDYSLDYDARAEQVRKQMFATVPLLWSGEELGTQEVHDFIVTQADRAQVTYFSPEAIARLGSEAAEGTDMLELLRLQYTPKPSVEMRMSVRGLFASEDNEPGWKGWMLTYGVIHSTVELKGDVEPEGIAHHIRCAQTRASDQDVEAATRGDEYRELINRYNEAEDLTDEDRLKILAQIEEIQIFNGKGELPDWDWRIPAFKHINGLVAAKDTAHKRWDDQVLKALFKHFEDDGLYLYERAIQPRVAAAQAIRRLQLIGRTSTSPSLGVASEEEPRRTNRRYRRLEVKD